MNTIAAFALVIALPAQGGAPEAPEEAPAAEAAPDGAPEGDSDASEPDEAAEGDGAIDAREAAPPVEEAPSILPAPTSPRLLVMELVDGGAGAEVTASINQAIAQQALKSHAGEVVTIEQIRVALDAASQAALVGCDGEECMTDVAKLIEAERVVGGSVAKVGEDFLITVLVVNARDGSRVAQEQRKVPGLKDMYFYAARQLTSKALTGKVDDPSVPVRVEASVEGAEVAVDGNPSGVAPLIVRLAPGQHEITVRAGGYAVWRTVASVEEAAPMSLTAELTKEALPLWPATVVAASVAAAGYVGFAVAGMAAQDAFDGSYGVFGNREESYAFAVPIDDIALREKQGQVETLSLTANALLIVGIVGTGAAAAIQVTDLIINAE